MGRLHPSQSFTKPHHTVYETFLATPKTNFQWMKDQCLQDEGVDSSSHHMRVFVWDFEGSLSSQRSSPEVLLMKD